MKVEEARWPSAALGQEMALRVYGHAGQPVLAFPSLNGRYYDFEGFGMVDACGELLDAGRLMLVAPDGIDWQSWANPDAHPADRGRRHDSYERYLMDEVLPFVSERSGRETLWTTGCSMGAYHAANLFFRHPDRFDGVIGLSGLYHLSLFIGDYCDDTVYYHTPLYYLPNLHDPWYLDRFRRSRLVFAVGQGAWEEDCLRDTRELQRILEAKAIPAWFDYWGHDVYHDWPWWRRMLPYFLTSLGV